VNAHYIGLAAIAAVGLIGGVVGLYFAGRERADRHAGRRPQ